MADVGTIIADLWEWVRIDIFGSDIIAGLFVLVFIYMAFSSLDLPVPQTVGLTMPAVVAVLFMGYMNWFGWMIVLLAGLLFGVLAYKIYGGR